MRRVRFNHPHGGRPIGLGWLPLVLTVLTLPTAAAEAVRLADVERAILQADEGQGTLKEKWEPVVQLLKDVDERTADPVLRIIKGHACLATNRNNEAVCLFMSVQTPEDKSRWLDWARRFAAEHPEADIANYFKGDALGRLGQWDEASACFALAIDQAAGKQHALAFNARGVAYACRDDFRKARTDFDAALAASDHRLADAYANIGGLCLQRKDGAPGGLRAFDAALQLSSDFALALHGRGCVKAILSDFETATKDLEAALQHVGCGSARGLLIANGLRYQAYWRGMTGRELLASLAAGEAAGTTFDARVVAAVSKAEAAWHNYTPRAGRVGGQGAFNNYFEAYGQLQRLSPEAAGSFHRGTVQPDILGSPRIARGHNDGLNAIASTNRPGGLTSWGQGLTRIGGSAASASAGAAIAAGSFGGAATVGAGVGGGGIAASNHAANKMNDWSNYHNETLRAYQHAARQPIDVGREMQGYMESRARMGNPASGVPGGCDLSLGGVRWDDGCWPFAGYFALGYDNRHDEFPVDQILAALAAHGDKQTTPDR